MKKVPPVYVQPPKMLKRNCDCKATPRPPCSGTTRGQTLLIDSAAATNHCADSSYCSASRLLRTAFSAAQHPSRHDCTRHAAKPGPGGCAHGPAALPPRAQCAATDAGTGSHAVQRQQQALPRRRQQAADGGAAGDATVQQAASGGQVRWIVALQWTCAKPHL
jgi:hypothetical protein